MTLLVRREPEIVERIAPLLIRPLEMVKRKAIESAMILCQGDEVEAAKRLGISRSGIRKMLRKYREVDECLA
jgi:DNA-binding NtrC family response regulator